MRKDRWSLGTRWSYSQSTQFCFVSTPFNNNIRCTPNFGGDVSLLSSRQDHFEMVPSYTDEASTWFTGIYGFPPATFLKDIEWTCKLVRDSTNCISFLEKWTNEMQVKRHYIRFRETIRYLGLRKFLSSNTSSEITDLSLKKLRHCDRKPPFHYTCKVLFLQDWAYRRQRKWSM